jgi:hypothetical protein
VDFPHFLSYQNSGEIQPKKKSKSSGIYTRKVEISQFIYQKLAKFRQKKNNDSKLPLGGGGGGG